MMIGLERYHKIGSGEAIAKFQIAKRIEAEKPQSIEEMQKHHSELKKEFKKLHRLSEKTVHRKKSLDTTFKETCIGYNSSLNARD